jgi:hypothetical protein
MSSRLVDVWRLWSVRGDIVRTSLVQGRPICSEMWPGNTADVKTLLPVVKRMQQRFRLREITVVADRGTISKATLEVFEKSDPPVRYIVGVRMRRQKEVSTSVLGSRAGWFESVPERGTL